MSEETRDIDNPVKLLQKLILVAQNKDKDKKPHNIKIKNKNPKEPKIKEDKRFTAKQKYRVYKTKIEPKLHSKITIDEEDDIVAELKKAFDNRDKDTTNLVDTSGLPEYENRRTSFGGLSAINDISGEDAVSLTGSVPSTEEEDAPSTSLFGTPMQYLTGLLRQRNLLHTQFVNDELLQPQPQLLLPDNNFEEKKIQKVLRGHIGRKQFNNEKEVQHIEKQILNDNATEIQKLARGYITRKKTDKKIQNIKEKAQERIKNESISKIQALVRRKNTEQQGLKQKLKNEAITSMVRETSKPKGRSSIGGDSFVSNTTASQADTLAPRGRGRPTNASKGLPTKQPPKKK